MTKYTPIESEFADSDEELAYDAWFRAKVGNALADPRAGMPHKEAMAWLDMRAQERRRARTRLDG